MPQHKQPRKIENLLALIHKCILSGHYIETFHAQQRQRQRKIILPDILYVLMNGRHEKARDKFDEAYHEWNYAVRGRTVDKDEIRVIVSFDKTQLLIITAFYLDNERKS